MSSDDRGLAIAIVGMAGRFPGAADLDRFWDSLRDGVESVRWFTDEELAAAGWSPSLTSRADYVRARAILDDVDLFDADFFGFSPPEAAITDPQHRIFLECAWEALENAGCDPRRARGPIGVFAGAALNSYLPHVQADRRAMDGAGLFRVLLGNDKEHLPAWVAYKLDLRGPAMNVQTACSTSLAAVHVACRSLLHGECDVALAGGVNIVMPRASGYTWQDGGILSKDGHCRAFDAAATGSVPGEGVGVVVLKRFEDAVADGDTIRALILSSAMNNDGASRVSFSAPGVEGQAAVIASAMAAAGIQPDEISYVECHGSGTAIGDPIEVAALNEAFRVARRQTMWLGSVKSNIGHAGAAAGIAGLIKTVLALEHDALPATLHLEQPNPLIAFDNGPFVASRSLRAWPRADVPRRAGVSSFGMGGTNVHVVLEEAPPTPDPAPSRSVQLLLLSARSPDALEQATDRLADDFKRQPSSSIADVAYTLQSGRQHFPWRRVFAIEDGAETATAIVGGREPTRMLTGVRPAAVAAAIFMLPGIGDHYLDMGRGIYETEPFFREKVDDCCDRLRRESGVDVLAALYSGPRQHTAARHAAYGTNVATLLDPGRWDAQNGDLDARVVQPAVFVIEYALASLWRQWGVLPHALIGYSVGELAVACLADVLSIDDALRLVSARAAAIAELEPGAMLAVAQPAEALHGLPRHVSVAGFNGPSLSVLAGPIDAMRQYQQQLTARRVLCRWLQTTHAFHTPMLQAAVPQVTEVARRLTPRPPRTPYVSTLTGTWMTAADAVDPAYWARHMCEPVRFWQGLQTVTRVPHGVLLEVGPGQTLTVLGTSLGNGDTPSPVTVASMRSASDPRDDVAVLMESLGRLWTVGVEVNWTAFASGERRRRVPLPTYPFQRERFWLERPMPERARAEDASSVETSTAPLTSPHRSRNALQIMREHVAPRTPLEETIAALWMDVLGVRPIGVHDTFLELGGSSLAGGQLALRLQQMFEVAVPITAVFQYPTVAALASRVQELLLDHIEQETAS